MDSVCNGNMSWNPYFVQQNSIQWHIKCFTASFISLDPSTYMTLRGMWNIISESQPLVWELRVHMTRCVWWCSTTVTKTLWWSRFTPWRRWTRGGWLDTWRSWPGKAITVLAPLLMFITQDTYRWIIHTGTCHDLNVIACRNTGVVADYRLYDYRRKKRLYTITERMWQTDRHKHVT